MELKAALPKFTAVSSGDRLPILFTTSPINKSSSSLEPFSPNSLISRPFEVLKRRDPNPYNIPPPTAIPTR